MKLTLAVLIWVALGSSALASEEQIHVWKQVSVVAATSLFGDVRAVATGDERGNVATLSVTLKGSTITVPEKWLTLVGALELKTIEIRSEVGYDPQPWLYLVFDGVITSKAVKHRRVRIAFQGGKLHGALVDVTTATGTLQHGEIKAP